MRSMPAESKLNRDAKQRSPAWCCSVRYWYRLTLYWQGVWVCALVRGVFGRRAPGVGRRDSVKIAVARTSAPGDSPIPGRRSRDQANRDVRRKTAMTNGTSHRRLKIGILVTVPR